MPTPVVKGNFHYRRMRNSEARKHSFLAERGAERGMAGLDTAILPVAFFADVSARRCRVG
jgi:hypothetical protein